MPSHTASTTEPSQARIDEAAGNSATSRRVALLLNAAHAVDHMFLLIFATAEGSIAAEFGLGRTTRRAFRCCCSARAIPVR